MSVLAGIMKTINNPYATVAKDGLVCGDIHGYMDSGCYALNALISGKLDGGYPWGKIVCLAGEKGTGKTFLLLKGLKEYLDTDPENEIIFFESEGALTQEMLEERGIDVERVTIAPVTTIEEFRTQAVKTLDYLIDKKEGKWNEKRTKRSGGDGVFPKVALCLDSLGMLGTEFEYNTAESGDNKADMGKRAQLIKSTFRLITLKMSLLRIPMIVTAHTYNGMGKYDPKKLSGGQGVELAASIIVFLTKAGIKDEGKAKIQALSGNNINFILHKGRMTIEGSKMKIPLDFKDGIKRNNGIIPLLVEAGLLIKKGAWFSYGDQTNIAQGEKKMYELIDDFVDDDVLEDLQPYIEQRFCYGAVSKIEEDISDGNDEETA